MPQFDLSQYETVEQRLKRFWADHAGGAVITNVVGVTPDHKSVIVRAEVWFDKSDPMPTGVGLAQETQGGGGPNNNCWTENCDTSAVGRALANCGYSGDKRASREEMQKASREPFRAPAPPQRAAPPSGIAEGEIRPCAKCLAPVRFAFENGKAERYNADGGLHFKTCLRGPTGYEDVPGAPTDDPFAND